jgi:hypothetical protein
MTKACPVTDEMRAGVTARIRAHYLTLGVDLAKAEELADDILGIRGIAARRPDPEAALLNDIAVMMSEFVDNWPNPKRVSTALKLIAKTLLAALGPSRHCQVPDCAVCEALEGAENWVVRPCKDRLGHISSFDICIEPDPDAIGVAVIASVYSGEIVANAILKAIKLAALNPSPALVRHG